MNPKVKKDYRNILLVANYSSDVGFAWWLMENFWAEIALSFSNKNMECFLIYPQIKSIPDVITKSPIKIIEHDFSKKDCRSINKLLKIINNNEIGYIYLTDKRYYDWLYFILRINGVKKIINHDHTPGERPKAAFHKKYLKYIINNTRMVTCDHYIGVSKFVRDRFIKTTCMPALKCSYIHNGIKIFDNGYSKYAHTLFNIPDDSRIIVSTGRATYYKGIDILIKCARILLFDNKIRNLYFLYIGDGPDLEKFKILATDLEVDDKFIFAGFRKDINKILPCCDIGIQVSTGEAFSLSILEYLCAGLATIVPDNCGNSEAITNNLNGILYSPGKLSDIVEKIYVLLSDERLRKQLGMRARESVINKFNLEVCNQKLITLLEEQFT